MNRTFVLGQSVGGCEVAYATSGPEVVLRCPCGQTFPVTNQQAAASKTLTCPECVKLVVSRVKNLGAVAERGTVRTEPRTGTVTHKLYLMILGGTHYYDAAKQLGLEGATGEKVFFRYVLPRQLRERIAELEAELASLKQRRAS